MTIFKKTPYGGIEVSLDAIASLAASSALVVYGVIGLSSKPSPSFKLAPRLLKENEYKKGISVFKGPKGYTINIYLICSIWVKIAEVASEVQKKVQYDLRKKFDIPFSAVNVYVTDVKEGE